jgi:DNA (cytosine-5)-methyltransferase 1
MAFTRDPRADLYTRYLDFVRDVRPLAIVMENVPDLMNHGGRNIAEEICELLEAELGYEAQYTLLNSAWYGVPQIRDRCFIVAMHRSLGAEVIFPEPACHLEIPRGYRTARAHAMSQIRPLFPGHFMEHGAEALSGLLGAVTAEQAIGDLPSITEHLSQRTSAGRRDLSETVSFRRDIEPSEYALRMRNWKGREADGFTDAHVTRVLNRDYLTFARMAEGDEYPAALRVAESRFDEHLEQMAAAGSLPPLEGSEIWISLRAEIVPPYNSGKFKNKWWKLRRDRPVRTLMAHIGKDTYSHIHYDGTQGRTITVREAARLQSFPDGFVFSGSMNHAFRQIGNAVPPLMAQAVAGEVKKALSVAAGYIRSAA